MQRDYGNLQAQYNAATERRAITSVGERLEVMSKGERFSLIRAGGRAELARRAEPPADTPAPGWRAGSAAASASSCCSTS